MRISDWSSDVCSSDLHVDDHDLVFVSLHYLMALLKGGETAAAARLASQMERYAEAATPQGRVSARVGVGTATAPTALARGAAGAAVDALLPLPYVIVCKIGRASRRERGGPYG